MAQATTVHRGVAMVENALVNLRSLERNHKPSTGLFRLHSRSVALVGAGASLDDNGFLLNEWTARGGAILTCNTALGALRRHDAKPFAVVAMEQVDVSDQLQHANCIVAAALSAHPKVFQRADMWFGEATCWQNHLCAMLGAQPLHTGSSAMTAAFSLAVEWGATHAVLVGMDLCYNVGGKQYATGAKWDLTCIDRGDHVEIVGQEERHAAHDAAGIPRIPDKRSAWEVPAIGGGTVLTSLELLDQIHWFEQRAGWLRPGHQVNASERGALVEGWANGTLASELDYIDDRDERPLVYITKPDVSAAIKRLCDGARESIIHAQAALDGAPMMPMSNPLVEQLAAPDILRAHELGQGYPPMERLRAIYTAIEEAAERVLELLDGQR